jgi:hypothetical protein
MGMARSLRPATTTAQTCGVSSLAALLAAAFGYAILLGIRRNLAEAVGFNTGVPGPGANTPAQGSGSDG